MAANQLVARPISSTEKKPRPDSEVKRGLAAPSVLLEAAALAVRRILRVDVGFVPLVERSAGAGAERDAQDRGEAEHERQLHRRDQQAAQAGEHDQVHHARLGQREEVAPVGRQRGRVASAPGWAWRAPIRAWPREENPSPAGASGQANACADADPNRHCSLSAFAAVTADSRSRLRTAARRKLPLQRKTWSRSRSTPASAGSSSRSTAAGRRSPPPISSIMSIPTGSTARTSIAPCTCPTGRRRTDPGRNHHRRSQALPADRARADDPDRPSQRRRRDLNGQRRARDGARPTSSS